MSGRTRRNAKRRNAAKIAVNTFAKRQAQKKEKRAVTVNSNVKRLSGFDKIRQMKVQFSVLYPELIEDVPVELTATAEDRIVVFEAFKESMQAAKVAELDASVIDFYIPWNMLDFCPDFGREKRCGLDNVAQIVNNFSDNQYEKPRICAMPIYDANGRLKDVKFWVSNGWHRRTAKIEILYRDDPDALFDVNNAKSIRCSVSEVATVQEAAECFVAQNVSSRSRALSLSDRWRARFVAREPNVISVVNIARKYGFNAESPKNFLHVWPNFTSGDILLRMTFDFRDIGAEVVERTLSLLSDPVCVGVCGKKTALDANFVGGLCHFIAMFERAGFAHDIGIRYMLSQEGIIDKVYDVASDMSKDEQQKELPDNCFGCWSREENKRYLSLAAAFSVVYSRYVPSPNSKSGFWSKCPSALRKLRHVAIAINDQIEREAYIANLQGQLMSRGHAAKWPKYSAAAVKKSRLTR